MKRPVHYDMPGEYFFVKLEFSFIQLLLVLKSMTVTARI
jgi:hypothetical protein